MPHYETIIVLRQDLSNTQAQEIAEKTKKALLKASAEISRAESWGLRTLSYPIRKNKKGHYFLINHSNNSKITQEMERVLRLNEDMLRLMTIRTDAPVKEPSPMLTQAHSETLDENEEQTPRKTQARYTRKYSDQNQHSSSQLETQSQKQEQKLSEQKTGEEIDKETKETNQ